RAGPAATSNAPHPGPLPASGERESASPPEHGGRGVHQDLAAAFPLPVHGERDRVRGCAVESEGAGEGPGEVGEGCVGGRGGGDGQQIAGGKAGGGGDYEGGGWRGGVCGLRVQRRSLCADGGTSCEGV